VLHASALSTSLLFCFMLKIVVCL